MTGGRRIVAQGRSRILYSRRIAPLSSNQKTTVIVVDDDPSVGRALQLQLGILGFDAVILESADKLLAGATPTEDACLLLDVYMPEMNGIELSRRLAEAGVHLPTILMSGRDDKRTRELMRKAKPVACLFKPFDQATLLRAIGKAMRLRRKA